MRIGAHVHIGDGLVQAVGYALETGSETIQVFAKTPRRWVAPRRDPEEAAAFRAECAARGLGPVFTHAGYLINLGAEDPELWRKSWVALGDELERAAQIGAAGVVVHLGRRFAEDDATSLERVTETVVRAADAAGSDIPPVLLENSAGAGRQFGVTAEEMAAALGAVREAGVPAAICFDTCHAFAAGIDVTCAQGWTALLDRLDALAGPGAVVLVHANDCKGEFGSHLDRHAWIGDGFIGELGFGAMLAEPRLAAAAAIIEMPGEAPEKDAVNVSRLKRLRAAGAASCAPVPGRAGSC
jgi:deoxyribonuclease IV